MAARLLIGRALCSFLAARLTTVSLDYTWNKAFHQFYEVTITVVWCTSEISKIALLLVALLCTVVLAVNFIAWVLIATYSIIR